jgi:hypothetical protein
VPKRVLRRLGTESWLSFLLPFIAYVVVGVLLDFVFLSFLGDATSRLADGFYVLYSLDPHLAAIGFVWNPLTSIASMPFELFVSLWPALASHIFAASLSSSMAMAGAVYQLRAALAESGVARAPRLVLTGLFALNPMIIYYAGNGMSEALYVFTLVLTTRYLLRWLHDGRVRSLVFAGAALGVAYLARNEAAGAAVLGTAVVAVVTFSRTSGSRRARLAASLTDVTIFVVPFVTSCLGWAVASFVITGQPLAQFTSQYGNSSQIRAQGITGGNYLPRLSLELHAIAALAPLLPVLVVLAVIAARRHRDLGMLAPVAILGGGLAFDMFSYLVNSLIWSFRFYITAAPLAVLLAGCVLGGRSGPPKGDPSPSDRPSSEAVVASVDGRRPVRHSTPLWGAVARVVLAFAFGLPATILTGVAMFNPAIGSLEIQGLGFIFQHHLSLEDHQMKVQFRNVQAIDDYIGRLHPANGSVIMDTFDSCAPNLVLQASNPKIFMITPDRAFQKTLADPLLFHAPYLMVGAPSPLDSLDALYQAYPTLYATGAGFARLVHTFPPAGTCPGFRLYRATGHASPSLGVQGD